MYLIKIEAIQSPLMLPFKITPTYSSGLDELGNANRIRPRSLTRRRRRLRLNRRACPCLTSPPPPLRRPPPPQPPAQATVSTRPLTPPSSPSLRRPPPSRRCAHQFCHFAAAAAAVTRIARRISHCRVAVCRQQRRQRSCWTHQ